MRFSSGLNVTSEEERGKAGFYDIDANRRFLDYEVSSRRIVDCGDVDVIYTRPDTSWDNATGMVSKVLKSGALPIVLGGDHGISYPIARAFDEDITVVHFDAHIDYQPFVHGVIHSHGNPMRMVASLPHVKNVVQVGIRSFRSHQQDIADSLGDGNIVLSVAQMRSRGASALTELLPKDRPVYVSIDVDVLDMTLVPGTSAPEPSGFNYDELRSLLFTVAEHSEVVGFDLVEVNPMLDIPSQATSFLGVQTVVEFLSRIVEHPGYRRRHPMIDAEGGIAGTRE
jgi:agmatinase